MKLFVSIISLLIGIMIGAATTVFLVVKKNPLIQANLCKDFTQTNNSNNFNPLSSLINGDNLKDKLSDIIENQELTAKNNVEEKIINNSAKNNQATENLFAQPGDIAQKELPNAGPGGCKTEEECLVYCSKLENLKECLDFAKKYVGEAKN
ncbi:MAG: hypothetical protein V1891_04175 [bacterium]